MARSNETCTSINLAGRKLLQCHAFEGLIGASSILFFGRLSRYAT